MCLKNRFLHTNNPRYSRDGDRKIVVPSQSGQKCQRHLKTSLLWHKTSLIQALWEPEVEGSQSQANPGKIFKALSEKHPKSRRIENMDQVWEHFRNLS
jgi:hypothetical protein